MSSVFECLTPGVYLSLIRAWMSGDTRGKERNIRNSSLSDCNICLKYQLSREKGEGFVLSARASNDISYCAHPSLVAILLQSELHHYDNTISASQFPSRKELFLSDVSK